MNAYIRYNEARVSCFNSEGGAKCDYEFKNGIYLEKDSRIVRFSEAVMTCERAMMVVSHRCNLLVLNRQLILGRMGDSPCIMTRSNSCSTEWFWCAGVELGGAELTSISVGV